MNPSPAPEVNSARDPEKIKAFFRLMKLFFMEADKAGLTLPLVQILMHLLNTPEWLTVGEIIDKMGKRYSQVMWRMLLSLQRKKYVLYSTDNSSASITPVGVETYTTLEEEIKKSPDYAIIVQD